MVTECYKCVRFGFMSKSLFRTMTYSAGQYDNYTLHMFGTLSSL